jgi:hypothetical protein
MGKGVFRSSNTFGKAGSVASVDVEETRESHEAEVGFESDFCLSGVLIVPQSLGETRLSLENTWESKLITLIHISVTRFACPFSNLY